jgi:hypothetical protein
MTQATSESVQRRLAEYARDAAEIDTHKLQLESAVRERMEAILQESISADKGASYSARLHADPMYNALICALVCMSLRAADFRGDAARLAEVARE